MLLHLILNNRTTEIEYTIHPPIVPHSLHMFSIHFDILCCRISQESMAQVHLDQIKRKRLHTVNMLFISTRWASQARNSTRCFRCSLMQHAKIRVMPWKFDLVFWISRETHWMKFPWIFSPWTWVTSGDYDANMVNEWINMGRKTETIKWERQSVMAKTFKL